MIKLGLVAVRKGTNKKVKGERNIGNDKVYVRVKFRLWNKREKREEERGKGAKK